MSKLSDKLKNISFSVKIILTVFLAILPMVIITVMSVHELKTATDARQMTLIENNFDQVFFTLDDKMQGIHDISTLISVSESVNSALRTADKTDIRQQLAAFEEISAYTRTIEMSHDGTSIYFFVDDEYIIAQDRSTRFRAMGVLAADPILWEMILQERGHPVWAYTESLLEKGKRHLIQVRMVMNHSNYIQSLGVLAVALEDAEVASVLDNAISGQYMALCAADGAVLTDNGAAGVPFDGRDTQGRFAVRYVDGTAHYVNAAELSDSGLFLMSSLPKSLISQEVSRVQNRVLLSYLAVFLVVGVVLVPVTSWMIRGIRQLGRQLADVPEMGLQKLKSPTQNDEIGQLITAYNAMVDEMERMLQTQYDLGRAKAGAELKALQSQINPHFLYNTLDMVSWMAQKQETGKIQQVMQALSQFYKLTLSGGQDIITLEDEICLCDAYMRIQQMRWDGAIDYLVEMDESLNNALLPKITLQPLIENAIKHGIMQRGEARGNIIVSAAVDEEHDGWMSITVLDNGVGMEDSATMMEKGSGSHYGMKNIEQRLALYYEQDIRIRVDSESGLGTCITLTLPIVNRKEDEPS